MLECWIDSDMVPNNFYMIHEQILKLLGHKSEQMMEEFQTHSQTSYMSIKQKWLLFSIELLYKKNSKSIIVETCNSQTNKSSKGRSWHNYCLTFARTKRIFEIVANNVENNADEFWNTKPSQTNICEQHARNKQASTSANTQTKRKLIINQHEQTKGNHNNKHGKQQAECVKPIRK